METPATARVTSGVRELDSVDKGMDVHPHLDQKPPTIAIFKKSPYMVCIHLVKHMVATPPHPIKCIAIIPEFVPYYVYCKTFLG